MVRKAELNDIEPALAIIKEFHNESMSEHNILADDNIVKALMTKFVDTSFVLELDGKVVGVLGGMITNYPLNNQPIYSEWVWYVLPKYRLHGVSLYHKVEEYCKEQGIKQIGMALLANPKADKLERFYLRLGFRLLEKHYIKTLGG